MGNCQDPQGKSYTNDQSIDAPFPEFKKPREKSLNNDTQMKFISQTADDEGYGGQAEDFQKILEMPKKMIRKPAPPFESTSYQNEVKKTSLKDYEGKYLVFFFYPYDFNQQFQEEILEFSQNYESFKKLNCELLGCSIDSQYSHMSYIQKPRSEGGLGPINFPLLSDVDRKISRDYGVLVSGGSESGACLRSTFIIDNKQIVRHLAINDFAGHIKADELLRMVKGLQEEDKAKGKSSSNSSGNLYDKIGGEERVAAAVKIFYQKMLADDRVSKFFKTIDMTKQEAMQTSFLCAALGGPKKYTGKNMKDAHKNMKLTNMEYDVTVGHLVNTLKDLNVDNSIIQEIGKLIEPLRKDIVVSTCLYDQLGGEKTIASAVSVFYQKMLADNKVSKFFKNTDMTKQEAMQTSFLCAALGGPKKYPGKNMKDAHKNMKLTNVEYDATVGHLVNTLKELNVDNSIIQEIGKLIEPLRKDIVMQSLYDQLGGEKTIASAVNLFYKKMLADNKVSKFFKNTDMTKQEAMQTSFLCAALGGPKKYTGKDMKEAHKNMKLTNVEFDATVGNLVNTLKDLNVENSIIQEIGKLIEPLRKDIVMQSLYDKLGGEKTIASAVNLFYKKMLADYRVSKFFKNTDMAKQEAMQTSFLCYALGGPKKYEGKNMREAHQNMKLSNLEFDVTVGHLVSTLKDLGVDTQTIMQIEKLIEPLRKEIVIHNSLFEQIGGEKVVENAVQIFYQKMLEDPRVSIFFKSTDMDKQRTMQKLFLTMALGGPNDYKGKNMKEAHKNMNLTNQHYDITVGHLVSTLQQLNVDEKILKLIGMSLENIRKDIVSAPSATSTAPSTTSTALVDPNKRILIDGIGGEGKIEQLAGLLMDRVYDEKKLNQLFANIEKSKMKDRLKVFLIQLTGGPQNYKGKSLNQVHAGLKINDVQFNSFMNHLRESLKSMAVENAVFHEFSGFFENFRPQIVSIKLSIFDRLEGEPQIAVISSKLYHKVVNDDKIKHFFTKVDPTRQKEMLKNFLMMITGGPKKYSGKDMKEAHSSLKINDIHFTAFKLNLLVTLKELQTDPQTYNEISNLIETTRKSIVTVSLPLLERLEGDNGVLQIVNRFVDRLTFDTRVKKFFQKSDLPHLKKMIHSLLLSRIKGTQTYTGKSMKEAHANLGLNDTHFNLIKDHMMQSMKDTSKDPLSLHEVGNILEEWRKDIVSVKVPLFQRIGGEQIVKKGVEKFYIKTLQDPRLKDFFKATDMNNLRKQNTCFIAFAMGGPNNYQGKNMKDAHAGMKINDMHYTFLREHISQAFRELGIDNITIQEIQNLVESVRKDIVSVKPSLYERIGGDKGLQQIIDRFFEKLTKNQLIGTFFQGIDQNKLKSQFKNFLSNIFDGPKVYKGKKLSEAHSNIGITDAMYKEFKGCMENALKEMNMNPQTIKDILISFDHFKKEIVPN